MTLPPYLLSLLERGLRHGRQAARLVLERCRATGRTLVRLVLPVQLWLGRLCARFAEIALPFLKKLASRSLLLLGPLLAGALFLREGLLDDLVQRQANDRLMASAAPMGVPGERAPIVVIEIDAFTFAEIGSETDYRLFIRCLVERISQARPKAIGIDHVFPQRRPRQWPADSQRSLCPFGASDNPPRLGAGAVPVVVAAQVPGAPHRSEELRPDSHLVAQGPQNWGHITLEESLDADRMIRTVRLYFRSHSPSGSSRSAPAFAAVLWAAGEKHWDGRELRRRISACDDGDSCDSDIGRWLRQDRLRFTPADLTYQRIPAWRLLPGHAGADEFLAGLRDRYVLIGETAGDSADRFRTPLTPHLPLDQMLPSWGRTLLGMPGDRGELPGVFVHAYILYNLLTGSFIRSTLPWIDLVVAIVLPPLLLASRRLVRRAACKGSRRWIWIDPVLILAVTFGYISWLFERAVDAMTTANIGFPVSFLFACFLLSATPVFALALRRTSVGAAGPAPDRLVGPPPGDRGEAGRP